MFLVDEKDVVNRAFERLMDSKLDPKHLPAYPHQIDESRELWPKCPPTKQPLLRFNRSRTAADHSVKKGLQHVFDHVRAHGSTLNASAAVHLKAITDHDLREKIQEKYAYMSRESRKLLNKAKAEEERLA